VIRLGLFAALQVPHDGYPRGGFINMPGAATAQAINFEALPAVQECAVCFGLHDDEIHDATVSIHRWLRREIERRTEPAQFAYGATVEAVAATIVEPMLF
jgi:hypothetical protein